MSVFTVDYKSIESSITQAKKAAKSLDQYASDMGDVAKSCEKLGGSDPKGYVNAAAELARKKAAKANLEKGRFDRLSKQLSDFESLAKEKDNSVARMIKITVSDFIGRRSWLRVAGNFLYSVYVGFVNLVSTIPVVGEFIAQGIRVVGNWISDTAEIIHSFFKYGDGRYIWNSIKAVVGALVAAAGVVTAAAGFLAAVPAMVTVAAAGVILSSVYAVLKFGDMMVTVKENKQAWELASTYRKSTSEKENWWETENDEGSISLARYYGGVSGVKDWINKRDFGGKSFNNFLGFAGKAYSWTENAVGIASSVCQITVALGNAQFVKGADGKWVTYQTGRITEKSSYLSSMKNRIAVKKSGSFFRNISETFAEELGFTFHRTMVGGVMMNGGKPTSVGNNYKVIFKLKFFEGYSKKLKKADISVPFLVRATYNTAKRFKEIDSITSNLGDIRRLNSGKAADDLGKALKTGEFTGVVKAVEKDVYKPFKALTDAVSKFEFMDTYTDDTIKGVGVVHDIVKDIIDLFNPSANAYSAWLIKQ